jgi:hypothetical protein
VTIDRTSFAASTPKRGDIVGFWVVPADQPNNIFIKRVIGLWRGGAGGK